MAERQKSRLYSNGNPVPESIVLQDGYCSEHFIYDYENEDQTEGYPSISDEDVEKKLRGVIGSGQEHSTVDLFLKAKVKRPSFLPCQLRTSSTLTRTSC